MRATATRQSGFTAASLLVAVALGAVYLALRPPLYNYDGYVYRLQAYDGWEPQNLNPHHLLWNPLQIGLLKLSELAGRPVPAAFQIFGIAVSSLTLILFHRLLARASGSRGFALFGTLLVASSPKFWFFVLQNQPYTLVFLFVVIHLAAWRRDDGAPPEGARLAVSAAALAGAVFFQQAAALLVPAAVVTLAATARGTRTRRILRALGWGGATSALVLAVYLGLGRFAGWRDARGFVRWATSYLETQHGLQVALPEYLAKSVIGILRAVFQSQRLETALAERMPYHAILALFGGLGFVAAALGAAWCWRERQWLLARLRWDAFMMLAVVSTAAWSLFAFVWEPLGYYWSLNLFPIVAASASLWHDHPPLGRSAGMRIAALAVALLSGWNLWANHERDRIDSINAPEPLVESIDRAVGASDVFIVLGRDWFGDIDYDLLFTVLDSRGDARGVALLHDFVLPRKGLGEWRSELRERIEDTLDAGGRVFIADHLFHHDSYADLPELHEPFSEFIHQEYLGLDAARLEREVADLFAGYGLQESSFRLGPDSYLELRRKPPH